MPQSVLPLLRQARRLKRQGDQDRSSVQRVEVWQGLEVEAKTLVLDHGKMRLRTALAWARMLGELIA